MNWGCILRSAVSRICIVACCFYLYIGDALAQEEVNAASENFNIGLEAYRLGNYKSAFNSWKLGAFESNAEAQYNLGILYVEGKGTNENTEKAHYWFLRAAKQQHPEAQYNLGHLYMAGIGINHDQVEAITWWRMASDNGYPLAAYNLGRAYYSGVNGIVNIKKAQHWLLIAASQGEPLSQAFLELKADQFSKLIQKERITTTTLKAKETKVVLDITIDEAAVNKEQELERELGLKVPQLEVISEARSKYIMTPKRLVKVYADPYNNKTVLMQLNSGTLLRAFETRAGRVKVQRPLGFPVWVESNILNFEKVSKIILENKVDYALEAGGPIVDQMKVGDVVSLLREQKGWTKVLSPWSLAAWIDEADFDETLSGGNLAEKWQLSIENRLSTHTALSKILKIYSYQAEKQRAGLGNGNVKLDDAAVSE